MTYREQYVWLYRPGSVLGVSVGEMNEYIKEYNRGAFKYVPFFAWLSSELGETVNGFSALWNDKNSALSHLLTVYPYEGVRK